MTIEEQIRSLNHHFKKWQTIEPFDSVAWAHVDLTIRRRRAGTNGYGCTNRKRRRSGAHFSIMIHASEDIAENLATLMHEMAHVVAWGNGGDHEKEWQSAFIQAATNVFRYTIPFAGGDASVLDERIEQAMALVLRWKHDDDIIRWKYLYLCRVEALRLKWAAADALFGEERFPRKIIALAASAIAWKANEMVTADVVDSVLAYRGRSQKLEKVILGILGIKS